MSEDAIIPSLKYETVTVSRPRVSHVGTSVTARVAVSNATGSRCSIHEISGEINELSEAAFIDAYKQLAAKFEEMKLQADKV
jgi:CTP synthase (UTP-ammonia lyase)